MLSLLTNTIYDSWISKTNCSCKTGYKAVLLLTVSWMYIYFVKQTVYSLAELNRFNVSTNELRLLRWNFLPYPKEMSFTPRACAYTELGAFCNRPNTGLFYNCCWEILYQFPFMAENCLSSQNHTRARVHRIWFCNRPNTGFFYNSSWEILFIYRVLYLRNHFKTLSGRILAISVLAYNNLYINSYH